MTELPAQIHLTEQQLAFVRAFAERGDGDLCAAALASGYAPEFASKASSWVTRHPQLLAALHLETARRLATAAPAALQTVEQIRKGEIKDNAKVRLDAAKVVLALAGHIAPRARALDDGQAKTLGEMSLEELKATQDRLNNELASRAKAVNAHPQTIDQTQADDLLS